MMVGALPQTPHEKLFEKKFLVALQKLCTNYFT